MSDALEQLAAKIRAATTPNSIPRVGTVLADPADGWIDVDVGGEVRRARVAGSFRGNVRAGQEVQLVANGASNSLYVGAILSGLPTPAVTAPPSPASSVSASASSVSGSGGSSISTLYAGFDAYASNASFADCTAQFQDLETKLATIVSKINAIISSLNTTSSAVSGVVSGVNSVVTKHNTLESGVNAVVTKVNAVNQTTAGLRSALLDQGHIA